MWNTCRLRKSREFTEIINKGKKVVNQDFITFYLLNQLNNCRFGISIPRKLVKKAVKRNYYKRQVKNMLILYLKKSSENCQQIHSAHSLTHQDFVIIIHRSYLKESNNFQNRQSNLYKLFYSLNQKELKNQETVKNRKNFYA